MLNVLFPFIGGIGLFLIGMMLLSSGLVAFAGGALQKALIRFTGTPWKAFASGALITALAQSSTATTVTLIGFVSAGLITFTQAIGVVIGASLGNTATGWIVAGLGLKINLGFYTLPFIGAGALLKLLVPGRWGELGTAIAGFGILFLGLNTMQDGMQGLSGMLDLARLPSGGFGASLLIMLIGLVMTAILQSSTAAIATTLTALHAGAINFDQAAAVVVGASVGTTLTSALATIGGTIYAKRTALAYILFNLGAGLIAVLLLPALLYTAQSIDRQLGFSAGALGLAAFHSLFIGLGVVLFMPFITQFARSIARMLPEREEDLARHLDATLLNVPEVALGASHRALREITGRVFLAYQRVLAMNRPAGLKHELPRIRMALEQAFDFVTRIPAGAGDDKLNERRVAQLHAIDHLMRLCNRLNEPVAEQADFGDPALGPATKQCRDMLALAGEGLAGRAEPGWLDQVGRDAQALSERSRQVRHDILQDAGPGRHSAAEALLKADAFRWLERGAGHVWRISHYAAADIEPEGDSK